MNLLDYYMFYFMFFLQLEVAKQATLPKSCSDVIRLGITSSRIFDLDIDGPHFGLPAVTAHCEIPSGITTIGQNFEVNVESCNTTDCFSADVAYPASLEQIVAIIQNSNTSLLQIQIITFVSKITIRVDHYSLT